MKTAIFGIPVVFGIREVMLITGLSGKLRLRMRPKSFAVVTQRTPAGVSRWHLKDCGDHWEPVGPFAVNHTITTK